MTLTSDWFADSERLQKAAKDNPPLMNRTPREAGDAVLRLQEALDHFGIALPGSLRTDGTADGVFGPDTEKAVRTFQARFPPLAKDGQAGKDTLHKMDELLQGVRYQFRGFALNDMRTLLSDLDRARTLARHCASVLVRPAVVFSKHVSDVLMDTFDTDGSDRFKVDFIQDRFANFPARSVNLDYVFAPDFTPSGFSIGHVAYVKSSTPRIIYITPQYFAVADPLERAGALIHEYIHIRNLDRDVQGHPGKGGNEHLLALFSRTRIGIEFGFAALNAYCYQYFAQWI